jgi:hypothetical protein
MNYFAHGRAYVDNAYFLAGTAVPDWLSVVDRRMRVRSRCVQPFAHQPDGRVAALAAGILQHHRDDLQFHQTRAFAELSLHLTTVIRDVLQPDDGFRPSFLGHILVEILLDAALIAEDPARLDAYYDALGQLDRRIVVDAVNRMATHQSGRLDEFIEKFCTIRFLYDYLHDEKLLWRLNHVMQRVGLPHLPSEFAAILPQARRDVQRRRDELLGAEDPLGYRCKSKEGDAQ